MMHHGDSEEPARQSLPMVLHFLQSEFGRFERERMQWAQAQADMQAQISFLEGQQKAEAALRRDLLRRIKMLEFALKTERAKNAGKVMEGSAPFKPTQPPPQSDSNDEESDWKGSLREGRDVLIQYLNELGYSDNIIHAQAQRIKAMVEGWPPVSTVRPLAASTAPTPQAQASPAAAPKIVLSFSDQNKETNESSTDNAASEENPLDALDFLEGLDDGESDNVSGGHGKDDDDDDDDDEDAEGSESSAKAGSGAAVLKSLFGAAEEDVVNDGVSEEDRELQEKIMKNFKKGGRGKKGKGASGLRSMFGDVPDATEAEGDLADLASFSIAEGKAESEGSASATAQGSSSRKSWKMKHTLRHHMDVVRAVAWWGEGEALLSASEDHTVKMWQLPTVSKKGSLVEPLITLRGHRQAVLCLAADPTQGLAMSGSMDSTIRLWRLRDSIEAFSAYDPSVSVAVLAGHTDAVWSIAYSSVRNALLSASADGTCKLWDIEHRKCLSTFSDENSGVPGRILFLPSDNSKCLVSFEKALKIMDVDTGETVSVLYQEEDSTGINDIAIHETLPLAVSADEHKQLKFYNLNTGECTHTMRAHQEALGCVDFDPTGLYLVSGGHDRSVRFWDVETKQCVEEITAHRMKFDESVVTVKFHPTLPLLVSGGADSLLRVYN